MSGMLEMKKKEVFCCDFVHCCCQHMYNEELFLVRFSGAINFQWVFIQCFAVLILIDHASRICTVFPHHPLNDDMEGFIQHYYNLSLFQKSDI